MLAIYKQQEQMEREPIATIQLQALADLWERTKAP